MVGQELGEFADALPGPLLDPFRHRRVRRRPFAPGQALVRDVPGQDVAEGVLALTGHRGGQASRHQPAVLEARQRGTHHGLRAGGVSLCLAVREEPGHRAGPERLPHHRRRLEDPFLARAEQVHPGRQHTLNGVGDLDIPRLRARQEPFLGPDALLLLDDVPHDLLEEERVAAGPFQDPRANLGRHVLFPQKEVEEGSRLRDLEWVEEEAGEVQSPAAPARLARGELGPGRAEEQEGSLGALRQFLEQLEQRGVRPVDVLDDHDARALAGQGREIGPPRLSGFCADVARIARRPGEGMRFVLDAEGERERRRRAIATGLERVGLREQLADGVLDFAQGLVGRILVQNAGVFLQHLGQRPVRDALAVREAPAPNHARRIGQLLRPGLELLRQPGLAHPRLAVDGHEVGAPLLGHSLVQRPQKRHLAIAAHHRREVGGVRWGLRESLELGRGRLSANGAGPRDGLQLEDLERADLLLFPLERKPSDLLEAEAPGGPGRAFGHQDLIGLGRLLQPSRHVDRVAGDHAQAGSGSGDRDHFAGVHADPHLQGHAVVGLERSVQALQPATHAQGRA